METYSKESTLRDYLRIVFKHKYLIILTVIPVMVINYILMEFNTPIHEASVKMIISGAQRTEATYYQGIRGSSVVEHAALVNSKQVLYPVVIALKLYERPDDYEIKYASSLKRLWINYMMKKKYSIQINSPPLDPEIRLDVAINNALSNLSGSVYVRPLDEMSNMFVIHARDFSGAVAAIIVNSVSRSYVIYDLQRQLSELKLKYGEKYSTVVQIQNYIEELKKTLDGKPISDTDILLPASVKIVDQAVGGAPTTKKNRKLTLGMSLLGGLMLGVVLSLVIGFFDERFLSPLDLETFLEVPMLGSIPKVREGNKLFNKNTNESLNYTNAFHNIAEQLYLEIMDKKLKSILITDIESSKETPEILAKLASIIGEKTGKRILIIDANLKTPTSIQTFNVPNTHGLGEVLMGKSNLEEAIYDTGTNISILPSGNSDLNPLSLVDSKNMDSVIEKTCEIYEMVFIISTGLNNYKDAVVMSSISDGVILVVDEEKDRKPVVRFAINPLLERKANIVGAILNKRTYVIPAIIYRLT